MTGVIVMPLLSILEADTLQKQGCKSLLDNVRMKMLIWLP